MVTCGKLITHGLHHRSASPSPGYTSLVTRTAAEFCHARRAAGASAASSPRGIRTLLLVGQEAGTRPP